MHWAARIKEARVNKMADNYMYLFAARVRNSSNVILCRAPAGVIISAGDRVIVSSKTCDVGFRSEVECFALTDSCYVDCETAGIIQAICSEQFPPRVVKGRYHIEQFDSEEVADAE
jgi:hypothetical protein